MTGEGSPARGIIVGLVLVGAMYGAGLLIADLLLRVAGF